MLTVGTTFSGIGSVELALKKLNIDHKLKWACDNNKSAKKAFLDNFEVETFYDDIYDMNEKEIEPVDFYMFGFPCQSFSINGLRGGFEDTRGTLVFESLRIIKEIRPKYFIAENVKGLTYHDKVDKKDKYGRTFNTVMNAFNELDYNIHWKVLNSNDYGIPQNRERIFIVGIRKDIDQPFEFPEPLKLNKTINDFLDNHNDIPLKEFYDPKDILEKEPGKRKAKLKQTHIWTGTAFEQRRRVYSVNGSCPCIDATIAPKIHYKYEGKDYYRTITSKEALKLQGFPGDFKNTIGELQMRKKAGNSITVDVNVEILKKLIPAKYYK